jgi:sporulation protein YlmC with PRC-barrel domain
LNLQYFSFSILSILKGDIVSEYKFDGKDLRDRTGHKIGTFDGKAVRDERGSKLGEFDGKVIRDSHGSKVAEFDGQNIKDPRGSKIGTINDVRKVIDGPGGGSLVAIWVLMVR